MIDEDDLKRCLKDALPPSDAEAEERAWQTVRMAFAEHEAAETGSRWVRWRHPWGWMVAAFAAVAAAVLVITPAGASVTNWVEDVFDGRDLDSSKVVRSIPGGGSLLVDTAQETWVTGSGRSNRRLGEFSDATWSPRGLFVAAVDHDQLVALEPDGDVRWTLTRSAEISLPTWKSPDGYRIAYLEGNRLRVVAGDGTSDRLLATNSAQVQPAWRPGSKNVLAFARRGGGVEIIQTDSGRRLAALDERSVPRGLQWSVDGARLLVWGEREAKLLDLSASVRWSYRPPPGSPITSAATDPTASHRVAVLQGDGRTTVTLAGPGQEESVLLTAPGELENPVWSPDGEWLNLGWPEADQWLFLHGRGLGQVDVVTDVAEQFSPGTTGPVPFPRVRGWCCQRR
ncbi:MAG: hypothetical protein ACSLFD_08980 [Solirubrobacterales bacterium]